MFGFGISRAFEILKEIEVKAEGLRRARSQEVVKAFFS